METKVIELRKQNKGYKTIANELGLKKHRVRYICQKYGMAGKIAKGYNQYGKLKEREKDFIKRFETYHPNFKYHSGYIGANDYFKSECRICGHIQERNAQVSRPINKDIEIQCDNCIETNRLSERLIKVLRKHLREREHEIRKVVKPEIEILKRIANKHRYYIDCSECGKKLFSNVYSKTCSRECGNKRINRLKELKRRNILNKDRVDLDISLEKLMERDKHICYICNKEVDLKDYSVNKEGHYIVGGNHPSIDHVIPISKGGTHTWDNVRLAHHHCNTIKRDNLTYQSESGQLAMYY